MHTETLKIAGLLVLTPTLHEDERGSFAETYKRSAYEKQGIPPFVQDNEVVSKKDVVRGLHWQIAPKAQGKLIHVIEGEILDVAVDVRKDSPTFGKHITILLSSKNRKQLWIPPGFAHGYVARSDRAIVHYKCTAEYAPELERSVRWNDPELDIEWGVDAPIVSERDARNPLLRDAL